MQFTNRYQAGCTLASKLEPYRNCPGALILGLLRGGALVAYEASFILKIPWDVLAIRKIGSPAQKELAVGAVAPGGYIELSSRASNIQENVLRKIIETEKRELERQQDLFQGGRTFPNLRGKTVLLVDDGLATGTSIKVAVRFAQAQGAEKTVVAVPVGDAESCQELRGLADEVICSLETEYFNSVGEFYDDFHQCTDDEILQLLKASSIGKYASAEKSLRV